MAFHPMTGESIVGHSRWVRGTHWIVAVSFLALAVSGFIILMCHPRLYWGETGNDLTPALIELPISRNHRHGGWTNRVSFFGDAGSPVSASRTFDIFNQNGWGRSLHFLSAWGLVLTGAVYLLAGVFTGHFRRHLVPRIAELAPRRIGQELKSHLRLQIRAATGGPQYGLLQKCAYFAVVFLGLPLAVLSGLAMSPAVSAAFPFLPSFFGGMQSARTIHFFLFVALVLFVAGHVLMVIKSGFRRQMRAMTLGETPGETHGE
jgi:thiosulfate reductase cytochrome b subunit